MSGIRNSIALQDKISSVLMRIEKQFKITEKAALGLDGAGGMDRMSVGLRKSISESVRFNGKLNETKQKTDNVNSSILKWGAGITGAYFAIRGIAEAMTSITEKVDDYTNMSARLNLINDGQQTTPALSNAVYAAAQRSRGNYIQMGAAVGKMGMLAGDAFSSNQEVVGFTELMQKSFKLGGSGKQEQTAGMYQLTQAMAAGKLQGDEFRSIMENAPMLAQAIAEYTGKSKGELKEMSAEGTITADIIKGALFSASDDIESKFKTLPMTFGDVANNLSNKIKKGFEPVFIRLSQMVNTEKFQTFMDNVANTVIAAGAGIVSIMDSVATVANFIYEHWSIIAPVLFAVATAMVAIKTVTLMVSAAQWLLNAALLACPLTWVLGGIILLIAAIPLLVLAINHFAGTSISATGAVVAVIAWAGMAVYNTFALVLNTGLAIVNGLWNGFAAFGNFLANCFIDPVGAIANLFADLANTVLGFIKSMASGVDTLLGTNSAGAIQKLQTKVTYWAKSKTGAEYKKIMPTVDFQLPTYNLKNVWNKSYKFGKSLGDNSFLDKIKNGMPDIGAYAGNYTGDNGSVLGAGKNKILDKVGNVGSVDKVNSEIDIADESLKYLVDGIIRGNINNINLKTTQPNFKIEFSGDITETADSEKIAKQIIEKAKEKLYSGTDLSYDF